MDFGLHLVLGTLASTQVFGCEAVKQILEPPSKVRGGGPLSRRLAASGRHPSIADRLLPDQARLAA